MNVYDFIFPPFCSDITNLVCSDREFTCKNKRCIPSEWLCDKNNNCGDNSDELNCQNKTFHIPECAVNFWKCHSGECIKSKWKCDFKDDCTDRSDEIGCGEKHVCIIFTFTIWRYSTFSPPPPLFFYD